MQSRGSVGNEGVSDSSWAAGRVQQEGCICPLCLLPAPIPWIPLEEAEVGGPVLSLHRNGDYQACLLIYFLLPERVLGQHPRLWAEDAADE